MNAYNQDNPNHNTLSRYKYEGRDDPFRLLVQKYSSDVQDTIIGILRKTKKMSEHDAYNFTNDMFSIDDKRQKDISDEIEASYTDGKTLKQCANQLIDKYYKIAKVNLHQNTIGYQTNRELSGDGEITEVDESAASDPFRYVSLSLFWNFISRVNDLGLKFIFDIAFVKNLQNSLNTKGYVLYMETPKINNREVEYEFKHSKMLSHILTYILGKETENETKFYVGFDGKKQLHFGFIVNNKRYKIGYTDYGSYDFQKLTPYITGNKDIDLIKLSKKFVTNIEAVDSIKVILKLYLDKYEDDIEIYNTILNSNFGIVIESLNDEIVSQQYIEEIIRKYVKISRYSNWYVQKMKSKEKTFYYFILK